MLVPAVRTGKDDLGRCNCCISVGLHRLSMNRDGLWLYDESNVAFRTLTLPELLFSGILVGFMIDFFVFRFVSCFLC